MASIIVQLMLLITNLQFLSIMFGYFAPVELLLRKIWNVAEQPLNKRNLIIVIRDSSVFMSVIFDSAYYKIPVCIFSFSITVFTVIDLSTF